MIVNTTVSGRDATVVYMKRDFTPCSDQDYELAKVIFADGDVVFLTPNKAFKADSSGNPCHHPAGAPEGKGGQFAPSEVCNLGSAGPKHSLEIKDWLVEKMSSLIQREADLENAGKQTTEALFATKDGTADDLFIEGSAHHVPMVAEQLANLEGRVVLHNHPNQLAGLSVGDCLVAGLWGAKEMLACSADGGLMGVTMPDGWYGMVDHDPAYLGAYSSDASEAFIWMKGVFNAAMGAAYYTLRYKAPMLEGVSQGHVGSKKCATQFDCEKAYQAMERTLALQVLADFGFIKSFTIHKEGDHLRRANEILEEDGQSFESLRKEIQGVLTNQKGFASVISDEHKYILPLIDDSVARTYIKSGVILNKVPLAQRDMAKLYREIVIFNKWGKRLTKALKKKQDKVTKFLSILKGEGNPCHDPKSGKFAPLSVCGMASEGKISENDIQRSQEDLKKLQKLFGTRWGKNDDDASGAKSKIRVQARVANKLLNDPEAMTAFEGYLGDKGFTSFTALMKLSSRLSLLEMKEALDKVFPEGHIVNHREMLALDTEEVANRLGPVSADNPAVFDKMDMVTLLSSTGKLEEVLSNLDPDLYAEEKEKYLHEKMYDEVRELIHRWANTSGDHDARSIVLQLAAKDEFGLDLADMGHLHSNTPDDYQYNEAWALYGKGTSKETFYRKFLRAQYDLTQELLAEAGIKELILFRGVNLPQSEYGKAQKSITFSVPGTDDRNLPVMSTSYTVSVGETEFQLQPMSSFAYSADSAQGFVAETSHSQYSKYNKTGSVFMIKVPASKILSTCETGFGCKGEDEFVVLGGVQKAKYISLVPTTANGGRGDPIMSITAATLPETADKYRQEQRVQATIAGKEFDENPQYGMTGDNYQTAREAQPALIAYNAILDGSYETTAEAVTAEVKAARKRMLEENPGRYTSPLDKDIPF
jgi:hypothetical protein